MSDPGRPETEKKLNSGFGERWECEGGSVNGDWSRSSGRRRLRPSSGWFLPPVPEGANVGSTYENEADRSWADMVRVAAVQRVAVSAIDRLVGRFGLTASDSELEMALIESSQSAQRALIMVAEASQLLADRFPRLSIRETITGTVPADSCYRREASSEMPLPARTPTNNGVVCRAVLMTLATSRVRRAWHAGVIDADTAMRQLDTLLSVICTSRREGTSLQTECAGWVSLMSKPRGDTRTLA
jgi:hypothetical protein